MTASDYVSEPAVVSSKPNSSLPPLSLERRSLDFRGSLALPTLPPVLSLSLETVALTVTSDCPPLRDDGPVVAG